MLFIMKSSIDRLVSGFVSYPFLPKTVVACKAVPTSVHSLYVNSGSLKRSEVSTHGNMDIYTLLKVSVSLFGT